MASRSLDPELWPRRREAIRRISADLALLHGMVVEEIGHPLPPDLADFLKDWLEVAGRAVDKQIQDQLQR